jgi:AcrR family transcriptional regulator
MGRPKGSGTSEITAARLLAAAEHEFGAHGFAATRLEDIAARVGLTRPSLLHHFAGKEALYTAVVEKLVGRLRLALLDGMTTRGSFPERLSATVSVFAEHLIRDPTPARILVRELQDARPSGQKIIREQVVPLLELAEQFIHQAGVDHLPSGIDVRATILDVFGAMVLYAVAGPARDALWRTSGEPTADGIALRNHFVTVARQLFVSPVTRQVREVG